MIDDKTKRIVLRYGPYILLSLFFTKIPQSWRYTSGLDTGEKILNLGAGISKAFEVPFPSFYPSDFLVGVTLGLVLYLVVYSQGLNAKNYRKGREYGSARFGTRKDIEPFMDPIFKNNAILTQSERIMMEGRPKNLDDARNKNMLIIGGSGSGKTRFWLKPNLMQCHSSYVVTDPKGTIILECGKLLQRNGYRIKIFNTINFQESMKYNPFAYIHSEVDILKLVNTLITNTKGEGKGGDDFWVKAETLLYTALIGYIYYEAPKEEQNFNTLIEFINASEVREDDEDFQNPVDLMFETLEHRDPEHFAVRQYKKYKLSAGDINCNSNLNQLQTRIATKMAERKCYLWTILENGYAKSVLVGIFYPKKNKTSTSLVGMTKCVTERRTHLEHANYCTV